MARVGLLLLVTGCSFQPGLLRSDATGSAEEIDGAVDAAPDVFVGTWSHRKPITIHSSRVRGGPHTSFPVMIARFTDAELAATARNDGFDIHFTAADGTTVLPYERNVFDGDNGRFRGWVRVPSISDVADTTIYMVYGNPDAPDQQQRVATWSAGYAGVWHLDSDGVDATVNNNVATTMNGTAFGVTGAVGLGAAFDGSDDMLVMTNSASLDAVASAGTLSAWLYYEDATRNVPQFVMASSNNHTAPKSSFEWATATVGNHFFYPRRGDGDNAYNSVTDPFSDDTWHHVAVTLDFATTTVEIFVDGTAAPLAVTNANTMWANLADPADWYWGGHPLYTAPFGGRMDELRASNVVRSPGWVGTEYSNQSMPDLFFTVGQQEPL